MTIVTVTFNAAATLAATIECVANQTYDNVEHIIIDGGSKDETLDILQQNEARLEYFVSEPDKGIYDAMNKGMTLAQGDYICILNADDTYTTDYVEKAVALARANNADIVYTDLYMGDRECVSSEIDDGVYLGHLNINHESFLVRSDCYKDIGPYRSDRRIVSDSLWIRRAYQAGKTFVRLGEPLLQFSLQGLSDGQTAYDRRIFIDEYVDGVVERFPFLSRDEAEDLYLFRFNRWRVFSLSRVVRRYVDVDPIFKSACAGHLRFCLCQSPAFIFQAQDVTGILQEYIDICELLNVPPASIRLPLPGTELSDLLAQIDDQANELASLNVPVTLHYISVYSRPSETFVYGLIENSAQSQETQNFVLFQHRMLEDTRDYKFGLQARLEDYAPPLRQIILRYLLKKIQPTYLVVHFAINACNILSWLDELSVNLPTLVMTHGIDVFRLFHNDAYAGTVVSDLARRPTVRFSAPSEYLKHQLIDAGIQDDRITVVPNSISDKFILARKQDGFYTGDRPLRIVNVGRLIRWKVQKYLIEALAQLRKRGIDAKLTIIYGRAAGNLPAIEADIARTDLASHVELIDFVDFSENPDYLTQFDLFVSSSIVDPETSQTETFGLSTVEAILAGLPVIVTDAGGSPEVIGGETQWSSIVPHSDSTAIADAARLSPLAMWTHSPKRSQRSVAKTMAKRAATTHSASLPLMPTAPPMPNCSKNSAPKPFPRRRKPISVTPTF